MNDTIGIPYAERIFDGDGQMWAVCPECDEHILLTEAKDFESMTGREYAEHYASVHEVKERTICRVTR